MKTVRSRLTYANVMSTIAVFFVLGGATAFAASHLAKNSVGAKQLKKNAVTAAKIKNGAVKAAKLADKAVTAAKIGTGAVGADKLAAGSVGTDKLANGSVTADKLAVALPSLGVVRRLSGTQPGVKFPTTSATVLYPFDTPTFTQPAGEDDMLVGGITARFGADCKAPREFKAFLQREDPAALGGLRTIAVALGEEDHGTGESTKTAYFSDAEFEGLNEVGLSTPTSHTFTIQLARIFCATGSPAAATATVVGSQLDVIGFK